MKAYEEVAPLHVAEPQRILYGGVIAGEEEVEAAARVIRSPQWSGGKETELFEKELAASQNRGYAVACNSGSSALLLALAALELAPGARVAMPALQFPTLYAAAKRLGYEPVLVDVDESLNMTADLPECEAAVFVQMVGNTTNQREVAMECIRRGIPLIVDACEGLGSQPMASCMVCTSTHAAHMISTAEGGAVFTDDYAEAQRLRRIRDWGRAYGTAKIDGYYDNYVFTDLGFNLRPNDICCAIGRVQITRLPDFIACRRHIHAEFTAALADLPLQVPHVDWNVRPAWFAFAALTPERDALVTHLDRCGIETRPLLAGNMVRQPLGITGDFPMADKAFREGLWWGVHPSMDSLQISRVIDAVRQFFA